MENKFLEFLEPSTRDQLIDIYGDNVPFLREGWDDEIRSREREALTEPALLDHYAYRKMFPNYGRRRVKGDFRQMIMQSADSAIKANFEHYAKGLIAMYRTAQKLDVPLDRVIKGPKAMLGYKFVNHQGLLEFGLTLSTKDPFPDYVVQAAITLLNRRYDDVVAGGWSPEDDGVNLDDYLHVRASYPRGKNSGLPWMASGNDRLINNLVLSANAGLAAALVRGYPVNKMFDGLLLGYVVFSRFQRSAKAVPLRLAGKEFTSIGIEARRRIINSTPKAIALACKPLVKWLTVAHLKFPEFMQDRDKLVSRIRSAATVRATDASRFDLRSGGIKLRQGLDVIVATTKHAFQHVPDSVYELLYTEAFLPTMVTVDTDLGPIARWSHKSALRSGASTTSRVGSIINLMYDIFVTSHMLGTQDVNHIVDYYLTHAPSVIQGDDMLKLFPSQEDENAYMGHLDDLKAIGMTVEPEEPTKFLGYLVTKHGDGKGTMGLYHSTNPLDNMFFPERFRQYAVASMLSRYVILKTWDAQQVVQILTRIAGDPAYAHEWYTRFWHDIVPLIKDHFMTHPVGAAKTYFQTLLPPEQFSLDKLAKEIKHDEDELLRHIAQTARFELNERMFGEDEFEEDEETVTGTLEELRHLARMDGGELVKGNAGFKGIRDRWVAKDPRVVPLLRLFDYTDDERFVRAWRDVLPQVSREISTDYGSIFVTNL